MDFLNLALFTWQDLILRISLAMVFGLILGWDRDRKNKPIDFRAYMIVCVTSCIIAMMAQELNYDFSHKENIIGLDLGKIISGVLTGIGFLGAGAIIKRENNQIVGTATGASIWAAGGIGLALGFGAYGLALAGFIAIAGILTIGGFCMEKFQGVQDKEDL